MATNHTVTPMTIEHYDQVYDLWTRSPGIGLTRSDSRAAIERYLQRNPGLSLVARNEEGRIVGAVLCGHDGARGYIRHLVVAEECRTLGIGRSLVAGCLARLESLGIIRSTIFICADNEEAQTFWIRCGWRPRDELKAMSKDLKVASEEEPC